ncbi:MAG TPA: hypothetical protein VLK58_02020 [Conexibacter sp.]|nr:hypothetical protein [Conexibacter sp.]
MKPSRKIFLALAGAALLGAGASPAAAQAAGFEQVASAAAGAPYGDGGRWVVYAPTAGTARVLDGETGTSWDAPIPCASPGGWISLVGGGQAIASCSDAGRQPGLLMLDLERRTWSAVAGFDALRTRYAEPQYESGRFMWFSLEAIGTTWLQLRAVGYHWADDLWLNWRTGELGPQPTETTATDLDAASLNVPLCAPLRRTPQNGEAHEALPAFDALLFDGRDAVTTGNQTPVTLLRCGSARRLVLAPDAEGDLGQSLTFGSGVVSWFRWGGRGSERYLYAPRCGVRLSWTADVSSWVHSSGALYRGATLPDGTHRIDRLALPGCAATKAPAGLRVSGGGRTAAGQLVAGRWSSVAGSRAELLVRPTGAAPQLRTPRGSTLTLRYATASRAVRWRVGGGAWHTARRTGGRWRLPAPRGTVTIATTLRNGGATTHRLTIH